MNSVTDQELLEKELLLQIEQSENIISKVAHINISGIFKFKNQVNREINFLKKIYNEKIFKKDHLCCSNLKHLEAVANQIIKNEAACVEIMSTRSIIDENGYQKKLCIDLILHGGHIWLKVVARNPKALTLVSAGEGYFGQKSIVEQAEEFIECSHQHLHFYKHPKLIFFFAYGIENALASELEDLGVVVDGNIVDSPDTIQNKTQIKESNFGGNTAITSIDLVVTSSRVNLCVSTMIAYVSALTNGGTNYNFESAILKEHAEMERKRPVKPILDQLFKGRELFCCRTAELNFRSILETLGGPGEKERGEKLLKSLTIVEDSIPNNLKPGGRIKLRSLAIFGTGEKLKAVTATANHAFIRSSYHKGVNFVVFLHESRTLTEGVLSYVCAIASSNILSAEARGIVYKSVLVKTVTTVREYTRKKWELTVDRPGRLNYQSIQRFPVINLYINCGALMSTFKTCRCVINITIYKNEKTVSLLCSENAPRH